MEINTKKIDYWRIVFVASALGARLGFIKIGGERFLFKNKSCRFDGSFRRSKRFGEYGNIRNCKK